MSNLKCPFCQQKLEVMVGLSNAVLGCPKCKHIATIGVWEELIRTRKALETLQEFITKLYLNGNITDEQLERYKKMLITALKQKDE